MVKLFLQIGVAYHCYGANDERMGRLDEIHKRHPNLFILMTECCQGFRKTTHPFTPALLGDWDGVRDYAQGVMKVSTVLSSMSFYECYKFDIIFV